MSALLRVYTDSAHTSEVAHTAQNSTTLNGATSIGATTIVATSTTGWPAQGVIDIDTGGNLETVAYTSLSGTTVNLSTTLANAHANSVAVVQWYYSLAVGDQTNGILNDGTNATPTTYNTDPWYIYNAGNQVAQNVTIATSSASPSTTSGYADTVVSITSATASFAASVSPANIAAGSTQEFWVCAEIPSGQSNAGNPQVCVVTLSYQSI